MRMVPKTKTWADNWNDVIRHVLFKDEVQRELLLVPKDATIIQFIDKYFLEDIGPDEILTDEKVRVTHYDTEGRDTGNKNVRNKYKEFDIYVHTSVLHNATRDRMQNRYHLIADRIKYLQLREKNICGLRFDYEDEYILWTKTVGYKRYHISFSYKTTV